MAKLENFNKVRAILRAKARQAEKDSNVSVVVGYTQAYAIFVHENLEAKHKVGQAKYLEQPAREHARDIAGVIEEAYRKTGNLGQSLLLGGLRLQRESQLLVPVDTGALKGSAFTRLEKG